MIKIIAWVGHYLNGYFHGNRDNHLQGEFCKIRKWTLVTIFVFSLKNRNLGFQNESFEIDENLALYNIDYILWSILSIFCTGTRNHKVAQKSIGRDCFRGSIGNWYQNNSFQSSFRYRKILKWVASSRWSSSQYSSIRNSYEMTIEKTHHTLIGMGYSKIEFQWSYQKFWSKTVLTHTFWVILSYLFCKVGYVLQKVSSLARVKNRPNDHRQNAVDFKWSNFFFRFKPFLGRQKASDIWEWFDKSNKSFFQFCQNGRVWASCLWLSKILLDYKNNQ